MKQATFVLSWLVLAIPGFAGTFVVDNNSPAVKPTWKSLGGDFKRTGLSENFGPELGCIKWNFETNGPVSASVTIGFDDRVHIACEDGKLYTLDANGVLLWSYDANSPLLSSPTIGDDGTVYVGSQNGNLYAVDVSGNLQWTYNTDGLIYSSPAISTDGNVYVCSQDGILSALGKDGSELWSFETKGPGKIPTGSIFASPAIANGAVYIAGLYDPNLYALDPNTGTLKWKCNFESQGWPFASPVIAEDGTIFQTLLYDTNLYAIDYNDGTIIWSTDLANPGSGWFGPNYAENYGDADCWSEPALGPDGTIYVSFDDPYLRAVDPNGNIKWVIDLGIVGGFTLTVGKNGLIYAAGDDGFLYVVDANGWEVSRFSSGDWLNHPVIAGDNMITISDGRDNSLMVTEASNKVRAIGLDGCDGQTFDLHWIEDLDADGNVNFSDLALLAADWLDCTDTDWPCSYEGNETYLAGDIDRDRYAYFSDLEAIADRWLGSARTPKGPRPPKPPGPPPGWPEPPKPPPKSRACFLSDTPVWVNGALVQISNAISGQVVGKTHRDPATPCLEQIDKIEEHEGIFECYEILFETGDCITVVDSHYFLSDSGRWVCVQDLGSGSRLQSLKGPVRINRIIKPEKPFVGKCYNLKIKGADRYFVGQEGIIARDW